MIIIALENIRSLYNIGAIMRTAEFLGFKEIALIGYSGKDILEPDLIHPKIRKTSLTAIQNLNIKYFDSIESLISKYPSYKVICIENNTPNTKPIDKIEIENNSIILFGNETDGVSQQSKFIASTIFEIPRIGKHLSLNVEASAAIVLYKISEKTDIR